MDFVAEIQDLARAQVHKARTGTTEEVGGECVFVSCLCVCVRVCVCVGE
jgi:hypothetical protein